MRFLFRVSCFVGLLFSVAALSGCGGGTTKVSGTVVKDGKPIEVSSTGYVQVTLVPDVAAGEQFTTVVGRCDADGKFEILDVKPGKYKVAVEQFDPTPQSDKLGGAFNQEKTPIVRQIDGKKPLKIDLSNPSAE